MPTRDGLTGETGFSAPTIAQNSREYLQTGTHLSRFIDHSGMDNESLLLKRNQVVAAADNYSKSMGDRVYYIQYHGEDGITPIKCPLKDEQGRTIFPDTPDGKYRKVNDVWYQATLLAAEEYELRVDEEMKERISDDETNRVAMGMTKTYYDSLCDPEGGTQIGMPANLAKLRLSCIHDSINTTGDRTNPYDG